MSTIHIARINPAAYICMPAGTSPRAVLHLPGCPVEYSGCEENCETCDFAHLFTPSADTERDVDQVAAELLDTGLPVTIGSLGEPFAQAAAIAELLIALRIQRPDLHIIVQTSLVVEDILETVTPVMPEAWVLLEAADVLFDSATQIDREPRTIDLRATWREAWRTLVLVDGDRSQRIPMQVAPRTPGPRLGRVAVPI